MMREVIKNIELFSLFLSYKNMSYRNRFDKNQNKFVKENYYVTEIKNTYVQRQILENIYQEGKISGEYIYVYNSDSTLKKINYKPIEGNFGHPIRFLFQYEKGKLKKVIVEHMSSTTYEYDKKGNWIQRIHFNNDIANRIDEKHIEYYN